MSRRRDGGREGKVSVLMQCNAALGVGVSVLVAVGGGLKGKDQQVDGWMGLEHGRGMYSVHLVVGGINSRVKGNFSLQGT